jgi:hypothetical protein
MPDLANLQTINFGGGQTGFYDPDESMYYDSGGNELSAGELSQYGAFTVGAPGTTPGPPPSGGPSAAGPVSGSGSGGMFAGITGLFSSFGSAMANAVGTARPTVQTPQGQTLVYNPRTGGYTTTSALTASATLTPLLLLIAAGGIIWFVMEHK